MLKSFRGAGSIILFALCAVALAAPAQADGEAFVVSSSINGDANFMASDKDGNFTAQEILQQTTNTSINVPYKFSYGNGLGDFNNDGRLDYIMAIGWGTGKIYISEKLSAGNHFGQPVLAGDWGSDPEEGGYFAMDFAVADYNEDGNVDFVLSLDQTSSSGLYLGDGAFGFSAILMAGTSPALSAGADAADFNNDGHADFVIAPRSEEAFFVNLGDGTGNFTTHKFNSYDGGAVWGVAAADFTGDGKADIVAAYYDYLYVYEGAGDGINFTYLTSYELPFNQSALDNHDFNGDGFQDLVVASYDMDTAGVAVFLGGGNGTFVYDGTYLGGTGLALNGVSAQPWAPEPVKNIEPVAVIQPVNLEVLAGDEIAFDGSGSYDEDGQIVSYEWDFGDTAPTADDTTPPLPKAAGPKVTGINPSHTYLESGTYVVSLWVVDDKGSTSSAEAEIVVSPKPEPKPEAEQLAVQVKFSRIKHYHFGSKHKGKGHKPKYLKARIKFPEGYDARKVDRASVCIVPENGSEICAQPKQKSDFFEKLLKDYRKPKKSISVKFDAQDVLATLANSPAKITELKVKGSIFHDNEWQAFGGSGKIYGSKRHAKKSHSDNWWKLLFFHR